MLAAASTAEARELDVSVDTRLGWDNNVFRSGSESKDGVFWSFAPTLTYRERERSHGLNITYIPTYEYFIGKDLPKGIDHLAKGDGIWRITPTTAVGGNVRFINERRLRLFLDVVPGVLPSDPDRLVQDEDDSVRTKRTNLNLFLRRSFSRVLTGRLDYRFEDLDYDKGDQTGLFGNIDSRTHAGSAGLTYGFSPRTVGGITLTGRFRESRAIGLQTPADSKTADVSFSISREITPSLSASVQAGPSIVWSEQRSPFFGTSRDQNVSFFAAASLNRRFRLGSLSASFTRFESGSTGTVTSSIVDQVTGAAAFRPDDYWRFNLTVSWNRREQVAAFTGGSDEESNATSVVFSVSREMSDRITLTARGTYRRQQLKTARPISQTNPTIITRETDLDYYVAALIFSYDFDSIEF